MQLHHQIPVLTAPCSPARLFRFCFPDPNPANTITLMHACRHLDKATNSPHRTTPPSPPHRLRGRSVSLRTMDSDVPTRLGTDHNPRRCVTWTPPRKGEKTLERSRPLFLFSLRYIFISFSRRSEGGKKQTNPKGPCFSPAWLLLTPSPLSVYNINDVIHRQAEMPGLS